MLKKKKSHDNKKFLKGLNKFIVSAGPLWLSSLTIGLGIIAFTIPITISLTDQTIRESSYLDALFLEIDHNDQQAQLVVDQYKDHKKVILLPTYSTTAYEAIINAGALGMLESSTSIELLMLYSHIEQWPVLLNSTRSSFDDHTNDVTWAIYAETMQSYVKDYKNGYDKSYFVTRQAMGYEFLTVLGVIFFGFGNILYVYRWVLMVSYSKSPKLMS